MPINNVTFKAESAPTIEQAKQWKKDAEENLEQIKSTEQQYPDCFTNTEMAEIQAHKFITEDLIRRLDIFIQTGVWEEANSSATEGIEPKIPILTDVDRGFYLYDNSTGEMSVPEVVNGAIAVPKTSVIDPETNRPVPSNLWFVAHSDSDPSQDMIEIVGKSVGSDVQIKVTYADHQTDTFIVEGAANRPDIQIGVVGLKCSHGIKVDFSKVNIIDSKTGEKGSTFIIGSQYSDTIYGSAGVDEINGVGGSDTLNGMDGADSVYGYASEQVQSAYSKDELGVDGDNTFYDQFGIDAKTADVIVGGEGAEDKAYRNTTAIGTTAIEHDYNLNTDNPSNIQSWFNSNGWTAAPAGSELVLSKNAGVTGQTTIDMKEQEGYMTSATKDGNDLVMNIVKQDEYGGAPKYYKVRVKDYFSSDKVILNINGSYVDMSQINIGVNRVNLTGTGNDGDVLIGPQTIYEDYSMSVADLGHGNIDAQELEARLKPYTDNKDLEPLWGNAVVENGSVTLNGSYITGTPPVLNIPSDSMGAVAFVKHNLDGSLEITVASNVGLSGEQVVIKVNNPPAGLVVKVDGLEKGYVYDLGTSPETSTGVKIDGAGGSDFMAGYKMGTKFNGSAGIQLGYAVPEDHIGNVETKTNTTDGLKTKIEGAQTFAELTKLQTEVDKVSDTTKKQELQKKLNQRMYDIVIDEINNLATLVGTELTTAIGNIESEIAVLAKKDKVKGEQATAALKPVKEEANKQD